MNFNFVPITAQPHKFYLVSTQIQWPLFTDNRDKQLFFAVCTFIAAGEMAGAPFC